MDELLEKGMATRDVAERKAIYGELSKTLAEELPIAYLFYPADTIVASKKVHGIRNIPDGLVRFAEMWKD